MNLCEKKFDLDKMQLFFISYKNVQICRHFGPRFAPVFLWFGRNCDVDSGTCNCKLDSSRLSYLCTFNLVIHTKCWKGAFRIGKEHFVWTTKLNTGVKPARWVKPEVTRSWIYVTTLSVFIIKDRFLSKSKIFSRRFIAQNIGSDRKVKSLTL